MKVRAVMVLFLSLVSVSAQDVVKLTVANNTVLVPVRVNGRELNFVFDTGSERSVIDSHVASDLNLSRLGEVPVLKNYRRQVVGLTQVREMGIGKLSFDSYGVSVADLTSLSQALGVSVNGVLGNDILQQFTSRLIYSTQELLIAPLQTLGNLGIPIKLRRAQDEFFIPVQIMSLPSELLLDTGTNSTNLSWSVWQRISKIWTPSSIVGGILRAGAPTSTAFLVCVPHIRVGQMAMTDQAVRVQHAVDSGAFSSEVFGGILGSDLLQNFEVTFDLKHDTVYLKKDPQFQPDAYRYVTIGVQFAKNQSGTYTVMSVWKDSPALAAGIHPGDRIQAINAEPTESMTSQQLSSRLHAKEGTPVKLTIVRDGTSSEMTLRTHRMLCGEESSPVAFHSRQ